MNLLGFGWEEIVFILLLVLVLFSPREVQRIGKAIGRGLNRLARSETWRMLRQTGEELRTLPGRLMREAALDEFEEIAHQEVQELQDLMTFPPPTGPGDGNPTTGRTAVPGQETPSS